MDNWQSGGRRALFRRKCHPRAFDPFGFCKKMLDCQLLGDSVCCFVFVDTIVSSYTVNGWLLDVFLSFETNRTTKSLVAYSLWEMVKAHRLILMTNIEHMC